MSLASEYAVIGVVLYDETALPACIESGLRTEYFTSTEALRLYEWAVESYANAQPINLYLAYRVLPDFPPWVHHAYENAIMSCLGEYIADMRRDWLRGRGRSEFAEGTRRLKEETDSGKVLIETADRLSQLVTNETPPTESLADCAERLLAEWDNPKQSGLPWPLQQLNSSMGPLTDELVYICSAESVGKTAIALQLAVTLAWGGRRVAFRSLESRRDKIVARLLAQVGEVNTWRLRTGIASEAEKQKAQEGRKKIREIQDRIRVSDAPANLPQLKAWAQIEVKRGAEVVVIDNMKAIMPSQHYVSTVEQFRAYSIGLKWLRDAVNVPVVILHHTNIEGDVSWARDIRRDADILIIMSENAKRSIPPSLENNWIGKTFVQFKVEKNREGVRGFAIEAEFNKQHQTFTEETETISKKEEKGIQK